MSLEYTNIRPDFCFILVPLPFPNEIKQRSSFEKLNSQEFYFEIFFLFIFSGTTFFFFIRCCCLERIHLYNRHKKSFVSYEIILKRINKDIIFDDFTEFIIACFTCCVCKPCHKCTTFSVIFIIMCTFTCT